MNLTTSLIQQAINKLKDPDKADFVTRYFKTEAGAYGAGDLFLGVAVPQLRVIAKQFQDTELRDLEPLLNSSYHEYRATALLILVRKYQRGDDKHKDKILKFYLKNRRAVNNWDLVDTSAPYILGEWMVKNPRDALYVMAKSRVMWERRMAVLATFAFIKRGEFKDSLKLAEMLLDDQHDLIHKAVGWMLREIGKKDLAVEERFLEKHYKKMPRTMLRYAIEKFPENKRQEYLKK